MPSSWGKRAGGQFGAGYDRFRTGLSYSDVLSMLWSNSPDSANWKYKRRGTVLGLFHSIKKGMWLEAMRREDEQELRQLRRANGGGQMTPRERFDETWMPEPNTGCWLWLGLLLGTGYGQIRVRYTKWGAHRLSYTLHTGPIPAGLWVLHRCDTPACVNPDHLFLGTALDNHADMARKGRRSKDVGNAKVTVEQVAEIRRLLRAGHRQKEVGARFGLCQQAVSDIACGRNWSEVALAS